MLLCLSRRLCITIYVQLFQLLCVSRAARHHIYVCFNSIVSIFVVNPRVSSIASLVFIRGVASFARPFTTRVSRAPPAAPTATTTAARHSRSSRCVVRLSSPAHYASPWPPLRSASRCPSEVTPVVYLSSLAGGLELRRQLIGLGFARAVHQHGASPLPLKLFHVARPP